MKKIKEIISFEEFKKTIYYTQYRIVIPLLDIRLDKVNFFVKGKLNLKLIDDKILELYELNAQKLK